MSTWPAGAPDPKRTDWRIYWAESTDTDAAAAKFEKRYGQPPEWIIEDRPWLYLGPIPPLPAPELEVMK